MRRGGLHFTIEEEKSYLGAEFEIFGKVQGVYFRNHTKQYADKLGIVGWIMNTDRGTVAGVVQGERRAMMAILTWLKTTGSPRSVINRAVLTENWYLPHPTYSEFSIRLGAPEMPATGTVHQRQADEGINMRISYLQAKLQPEAQMVPGASPSPQGRHPTNHIRPMKEAISRSTLNRPKAPKGKPAKAEQVTPITHGLPTAVSADACLHGIND
mmetsp:Transcript_19093/g.48172  ORF Transcript_19093/g.48172 Transcript_19093/m.48172 type:complete len:213 (-) Transcript_19093:157-795(-)